MRKMKLALCFILLAMGFKCISQIPQAADELNLLKGASDLHVHTSPDVYQRSIDDLELARISKRYGLANLVIKNHVSSTAGRAELVNKTVEGITVYGGLVLNHALGGINPSAVESMAKLSPKYGKFVWLPTFDSDVQSGTDGIEVLENNQINPQLNQILDLVARYNLVLCTGHVSPSAVLTVVEAAAAKGIEKILITHALADYPNLNESQLRKLVSLGAKIELTYLSSIAGPQAHLGFLRNSKQVSIEFMSGIIKSMGAEHFVLTSDLGQSGNAIPPDGLRIFAENLQQQGISSEELHTMLVKNPAELLNFE